MEVLGVGRLQRDGVPAEKAGACTEQDKNHSTEDAAQGEDAFPRDSWRRAGVSAHAIQQQKSTEGRNHFSFLL